MKLRSAMQGEVPASLPIGTHVSAKYKGAFCEAKVRSVVKQVKCRVTFKGGLGSTTLSDEYVQSEGPLTVGATVKARHPDKQEYIEATINKIQDQSQYTVVFDDGDITSLRRNALCMKSGKHYNASESLDNLPLTHPEHFSTPVSGKRKRRGDRSNTPSAAGDDSDNDDDVSSENDDAPGTSYLNSIGRCVWVENTDKKSSKAKDNWFPAVIVAPSSSGQVKIDTKEEFLIRSFLDGRFYTVSKKDATKFFRDSSKDKRQLSKQSSWCKDAIEKAQHFLQTEELPPHWDKDILFNMGTEESTTESSEESESICEDTEEEEEEDVSPEEKDRVVAELYKHMEDRGSPINRTPIIANREVDLFKLFTIVWKMGGHARVSNNNNWRTVAQKLGFDTTWCINQVRVHYKRYLQSFEEIQKTLGCTMITTPTPSSNRVQIRGKHRSGSSKAESNLDGGESDKSSIASHDESTSSSGVTALSEKSRKSEEEKEVITSIPKEEVKEEKEKKVDNKKKSEKNAPAVGKDKGKGGKKEKEEADTKAKTREEAVSSSKMATRPRRDSTSSLAAAMQNKANKDTIGDDTRRPVVRMDRDKETEIEARKLQAKSPTKKDEEKAQAAEAKAQAAEARAQAQAAEAKEAKEAKEANEAREAKKKEKEEAEDAKKDKAATPSTPGGGKKKFSKKKQAVAEKEQDCGDLGPDEEKQDLAPNVDTQVGDKIKVYYRSNQVYEAKVIKLKEPKDAEKYPRFLVHYQGWNARYDEWIKRERIAQNLSWTKDRPIPKPSVVKKEDASDLVKVEVEEATPASKKETKSAKKEEKSSKEVPKEKTTPARGGRGSKAETPGKAEKGNEKQLGVKGTHESRSSTPSVSSRSRTGSPALKRQTSRSSIKKESEDSGDETGEESGKNASRKSSRRLKTHPGTPNAKDNSSSSSVASASKPASSEAQSDGRRSARKRPANSGAKDESENEEVDVEKEVAMDMGTPSKAKRGKRGASVTKELLPAQSPASKNDEESDSSTTSTRASRTPTRERATTRQSSASSGSKGKETPTGKGARSKIKSEDEEDPYAFKEPEPLDESAQNAPASTPGKPSSPKKPSGTVTPVVADSDKSVEKKKPTTEKAATRSKRESDSTDSSSDESLAKKATRTSSRPGKGVIGGVSSTSFTSSSSEEKSVSMTSVSAEEEDKKDSVKSSASSEIEQGGEIETCKPGKDAPLPAEKDAEVKGEDETKEAESDEFGKPLLSMTKKQQELFPFLSKMRTTPVAGRSGAGKIVAAALSSPSAKSTSSSSEDDKTDLKSKEDSSASVAPASTTSVTSQSTTISSGNLSSGGSISSPNPSVDVAATGSPGPKPGSASKKSIKKRRTPRKPNSFELVESESDSDGNSEDDKPVAQASKTRGSAKKPESTSTKQTTKVAESSESEEKEKSAKSTRATSSQSSAVAKKPKKEEQQEELDDDLVCGETIPGSPVHTSSSSEAPPVAVPSSGKPPASSRLEMPFASVPESIPGPVTQAAAEGAKPTPPDAPSIAQSATKALPSTLTPANEVATANDETLDSSTTASQSPGESQPPKDGSKSPAESSEVDMESLSGRKAESDDSRLDVEGSLNVGGVAAESRRGGKRKAPNSPAPHQVQTSASKRKRKSRGESSRGGGPGSRGGRGGRQGSGRFGGGAGRQDDETDESEEHRDSAAASLGALNNEDLIQLTKKAPKSKYNFFVDLTNTEAPNDRISKIQESIEALKKCYNNIKGDLAQIERRRKKMKRKERERAEKQSAGGNSSASGGSGGNNSSGGGGGGGGHAGEGGNALAGAAASAAGPTVQAAA